MDDQNPKLSLRMKLLLLVAVAISALISAWAYPEKEPLVQLSQGYVRGKREHASASSRAFLSFRGIPYAQPPLGDLRFKAPVPVKPWHFPVDATKEGPFCIQKNYFFANPTVQGQEDCLYLNVYVPRTRINELESLPVMVFIHWGGFFAGRATSDYLGPEYFMEKDVILVTLNYRLGALGFLTTLDDEAPGNYGMKDQVLALTFVQENIKFFGGNRDRVTLFGQSAGGGSASLHLVSPESKGLFRQVISQSGSAFNAWAFPLNALQPNVTAAQAALVGCGEFVGNSAKMVDCLRKVDAARIVDSADAFKYFSTEPLTVFTLVVEQKSERNPKPFITKAPLEYFKAGEFQRLPWIVGNVQDEGILRAAPFVRQKNTLRELNANFSLLLPQLLYLQVSVFPDPTNLYKNITDYYFGGQEKIDSSDPSSIQALINVYADRGFVYGTNQAVLLQSLQKHFPIWLYSFGYRGELSYGDLFAATSENVDNFTWGVSHCDDLLYLFRSPGLFPELRSEHDLEARWHMVELWTNFAIYGDPDHGGLLGWQPLQFEGDAQTASENLVFLNVSGRCSEGVKFGIQSGFYSERMRFWERQALAENALLLA